MWRVTGRPSDRRRSAGLPTSRSLRRAVTLAASVARGQPYPSSGRGPGTAASLQRDHERVRPPPGPLHASPCRPHVWHRIRSGEVCASGRSQHVMSTANTRPGHPPPTATARRQRRPQPGPRPADREPNPRTTTRARAGAHPPARAPPTSAPARRHTRRRRSTRTNASRPARFRQA